MDDSQDLCYICYEKLQHPLTLPCNHYFCYLCVKGVATNITRNYCPVCRQPFPVRLITQPTICEDYKEGGDEEVWFYEGRNGWWQYDERTNKIIEDAFKNDQKSIEILIAGHMYKIDFEEGLQYQTVGNLRRRRIKREKISNMGSNRKGTAGVPCNDIGLDILRLNDDQ